MSTEREYLTSEPRQIQECYIRSIPYTTFEIWDTYREEDGRVCWIFNRSTRAQGHHIPASQLIPREIEPTDF